ncbi:MAG: ABC transporter permease, partial [Vicinamibacterales bacterium]
MGTGIAVDELVTWRISLPSTRYRAASIPQFYRSAFERLSALPQVRSVSAALVVPFTGSQGRRTVTKDAGATTKLLISSNIVAPNYFSTVGIPILSGRDFTDAEVASGSAVAIVSASLARLLFGTTDAVGRELAFDDTLGRSKAPIVAVVADAKTTRTTWDAELRAYTPGLRSPRMALTVRLRHQPQVADLQALQTVVRSIDPQVPADFRPMAELLFDEISLPALRTGLLIAFGTQAVLVAAISMLGLMRWRVSQRTPELALRVAIGATPANLRRVLVKSEMGWVLAGITAGTLGIVILMPLARSMLMLVEPLDPMVLALALAILGAIALFSVLLPAGRIAR